MEKSDFLAQWLRSGQHGEMRWMEHYPQKRRDVRALLPGARSVIVVAHNYYTPYKHSKNKNTGKISRYAWGKDYHKIIRKKLKRLLAGLRELDKNVQGRVFTDTAPIQDKLWAEQAGIGWQGKNTNIISREMGSWFFIGEVVVNIDLEYDRAAADYCGSCRACIESCPTQALTEYQLDARRCLSYLTIEYWDKPIPEEFSGRMENWIFGCDICQDVCPWNRFARETDEPAYFPAAENIQPSLQELSKMTEQDFAQRFQGSPVSRAKYKNFVRNVQTILKKDGNG